MISVTGYDKGNEPRVYGRHMSDPREAMEQAKKYARRYVEDYPATAPLSEWCFKQDACDRQLFQPSK